MSKRFKAEIEFKKNASVQHYQDILKKHGTIDVVIGGPPCQGFSNANRQKNHAVSQNNMLIKQYIRAITELKPKAFVMENVSMLRSEIHRFYMSRDEKESIDLLSVPTIVDKIELLPKGHYIVNAEAIVKDPEKIAKYLWNPDSYLLANIIFKKNLQFGKIRSMLTSNKNKFSIFAHELQEKKDIDDAIYREDVRLGAVLESCLNEDAPIEDLLPCLLQPILTQRMLGKALEIIDNDLLVEKYTYEDGVYASIRSYAVLDYLKKILGSEGNNYAIDCGVLGAADFGAPQKRMRFVVMGIKKDISTNIALPNKKFSPENYRKVSDALEDLQDVSPVYDVVEDQNGIVLNFPSSVLSPLAMQLRDSAILHNHIITRTRETALERFGALKQGENFHNLVDELKSDVQGKPTE